MNRTLAFVLTVTMVLSLVAMSGTATAAQDAMSETTTVAQDEWPDNCDEAPIIDSGQYSGVIDTPNDEDYFRLRMDKGEYYGVNMIVPIEEDKFRWDDHWSGSDPVSYSDLSNIELLFGTPGLPLGNIQPEIETSMKVFAEEDGVHCFSVYERGDADVPYEWQMNLEKNDPEPAGFEITELQEENEELESEISELESQLEEKNERISELESQLENSDVTIDVSVEPEDQATLEVGGEMSVSVAADGASPSDVTLRFGGETYTPSGGGATIPLESAGAQELSIEYEDTTETVTLDVAQDDSSSDDGTDAGDTTTDDDASTSSDQDTSDTDDGSSDGSGPGFGVGIALVAVVSLGVLFQRKIRK